MHRLPGIAPALAVVLAVATAPFPAAASDYASDQHFGLGIVLGEPTGLSFKAMFGAGHGLQGSFAYELIDRDRMVITLDYLWHPTMITSTSAFDVSWHVGVGGFLGIWFEDHKYDCRGAAPDPVVCDDTRVGAGAHFPVGLDLLFKGAPVEIFLEAAPGLTIFPGTDFAFFGGFGGRWFF